MSLHQLVDDALGLEATGVINFKLLQTALHSIINSLEVSSESNCELNRVNNESTPTALQLVNHQKKRYESLHDSTDLVKDNLDYQKLQEKHAVMDKTICAMTITLNGIVRELHIFDENAFGVVDQLEGFKEELCQQESSIGSNDDKIHKKLKADRIGKYLFLNIQKLQRKSRIDLITILLEPTMVTTFFFFVLSLGFTEKTPPKTTLSLQSQSRLVMKPSGTKFYQQQSKAVSELRQEVNSMKTMMSVTDDEYYSESVKLIKTRLDYLETKVKRSENEMIRIKILEEAFKEKLDTFLEQMTTKLIEHARENDEIIERMEGVEEVVAQLKHHKVNCEELNDLLSNKAAYDIVRLKVSSKHFEALQSDIEISFTNLRLKLETQQIKWNEKIKALQDLLETKLIKTEVSSVTARIESKVQNMHDKLLELNSLKRENAAIGTNMKVFTGKKCISCNSNVAMEQSECNWLLQNAPTNSKIKSRVVKSNKFEWHRRVEKSPLSIQLSYFGQSTTLKEDRTSNKRNALNQSFPGHQ